MKAGQTLGDPIPPWGKRLNTDKGNAEKPKCHPMPSSCKCPSKTQEAADASVSSSEFFRKCLERWEIISEKEKWALEHTTKGGPDCCVLNIATKLRPCLSAVTWGIRREMITAHTSIFREIRILQSTEGKESLVKKKDTAKAEKIRKRGKTRRNRLWWWPLSVLAVISSFYKVCSSLLRNWPHTR